MTNKTKTLMKNKTKTIAKKAPAKKVTKTRPTVKVTTALMLDEMTLTTTLTVKIPQTVTMKEMRAIGQTVHAVMAEVMIPTVREAWEIATSPT
jgi:hypothetical protein